MGNGVKRLNLHDFPFSENTDYFFKCETGESDETGEYLVIFANEPSSITLPNNLFDKASGKLLVLINTSQC